MIAMKKKKKKTYNITNLCYIVSCYFTLQYTTVCKQYLYCSPKNGLTRKMPTTWTLNLVMLDILQAKRQVIIFPS